MESEKDLRERLEREYWEWKKEKHEYVEDDDAVSRGLRYGCFFIALILAYLLIRFIMRIDRASWLALFIFVLVLSSGYLWGVARGYWK